MSKTQVTILGATGSIGESTLDVIGRHPERYSVYALTAHKRIASLIRLAKIYQPEILVVAEESDLSEARSLAAEAGLTCEVLAGSEALCQVASADEVDTVMAAIVGAAGLLPTLAAARTGKKLLLANKESLVMSGQIFMDAVRQSKAQLLPIDSEHNAIFQSLPENFQYGQLNAGGIEKILLTGSGGPFLSTPVEALSKVTPEQACAHPNWSMGQKISVDSATMMNKGLEFIEACWLFGLQPDDIEVVIHPQSVIHSMVRYKDGSVIAQMGNPDMRTPIAHGLAYPERIDAGVAPLDFSQLADFSFTRPDWHKYPNLKLAIDAASEGQAAATALNAANEIAVEAFLQKRIGFTQIAELNQELLSRIQLPKISQLEDILALDIEARQSAHQILRQFAC